MARKPEIWTVQNNLIEGSQTCLISEHKMKLYKENGKWKAEIISEKDRMPKEEQKSIFKRMTKNIGNEINERVSRGDINLPDGNYTVGEILDKI
ncbi:hypothetical protein ACVS9P_03005 [Caproicibacterium sp. NSD3]